MNFVVGSRAIPAFPPTTGISRDSVMRNGLAAGFDRRRAIEEIGLASLADRHHAVGCTFVVHVSGDLAEFERDLIRERARADLETARALATPSRLARKQRADHGPESRRHRCSHQWITAP